MMVTHALALQTSRQAQLPLLCFSCEQLLRERGEDWVTTQLAQYGNVFPLGEELKTLPSIVNEPDLAAYELATSPTIRANDLTHFAMGIFWKASVHTWVRANTKPFISLSPYEEPIRKFLLGEQDFPAHIALSLVVLPMPVELIGFHFPFETASRTDDRTYHLYVPGLSFTLWVGPEMPWEISMGALSKRPYQVLVHDVAPLIAKRYKEAYAAAKKARKLKTTRNQK